MAALQTIRSKGALLVGVLGLALFAFIAGEFFQSIETSTAVERSQVGQVYGEKLSIVDFQNMVEEESLVEKMQLLMQGQDGNLGDAQTEQIRERVWNQFIQKQVVAHQCEELGIYVTDGEVQEALRQGRAASLQQFAAIFNPQTRSFQLAELQAFLKDFNKMLQQAQQAQNGEMVEQIQTLKKLWDYTEKKLRDELLMNKYNMLFAMGFVSNPIAAQTNFNERTNEKSALVAALPYSTIKADDIKVSDEELKAAYEQYKEDFYSPVPTRDLKVLDVNVVASATDRADLMKKVQGFEEQLRSGADVANVVRSSNSAVQYSNLAMGKQAFQRMRDVAQNLDSMAVGSVKATYYNAMDNTINTMKLVAKYQAPDSVLLRQIVVTAATPEARKTRTDSILNAVKGGASFAEIAKKCGQPTDSMWMPINQFENFGMSDEQANYITKLSGIAVNATEAISNSQVTFVVQVLDRRQMTTKYNVAVVKCPLNFSKKTYEDELSKLNGFLAKNRDIAAIEKNAPKQGYMLMDVPGYSPMQNMIPARIGGSQAKDCARWIFDEAKAGDVSKLYECGHNNDHLLVVLVKNTNDKGYLPWDNSEVKNYLTEVVKQQKKADKALAMAKGVKTVADMQKLQGSVADSLNNQTFAGYAVLRGVNVPEPKLVGAIAKTAAGKTSQLVKGAGAVYVAQVTGQTKKTDKFVPGPEMMQLGQMIGQRAYQSVFGYLLTHKAEIKDNRYQF